MQLLCPRCRHTLEFSGERPSFCAYCGSALSKPQDTPDGPVDGEAATVAPDPAAPGGESIPEVVGGYRLLRVLGVGGMGTVYEAEDAASGRRVALKLISPEYAGSADAVQRFRQEGRLASSIAHPRCVFVLAADEEAGRPYIVMELMPGSTLDDLVADKGPLAPEEAIAAILDVIEGLEEAHRHGVIHRDVKPSNCFLDADGRIKVGDFGLSKSLAGNAHLTRTGSFLGTPLYASPEQIKSEPLDAQTDVYSAAATLYYLLTGRAPFQSGDMAATLARIVSDPAPSLRELRPDLDPLLDQVILRGLDRERARRWRDLAEFKAALQEFLPGGLSIGGLGIRFGAIVIDYFLLAIANTILSFVVAWLLGVQLVTAEYDPKEHVYQLVGLLPWLIYFWLLEGVWGASLGKVLLRLRVRRSQDTSAPGLARGLARAGVWTLLLNLGTILWWVSLVLFVPEGMRFDEMAVQTSMRYALLSFVPLGGMLVGIGIVLLPMRQRNGYRGLHEFLSGTRVVLLPPPARRGALHGERFAWPLVPAEGCPERLGAFVIRGKLRGNTGTTVLVGQDTILGRDVWIWLRPLSEPPLSDARRQISRTTRLRWLACGTHGDAQWDAFIAPSGSPLLDIIRQQGRFAWPEVRPLLEGLTEELVEACAEETVPDPLRLEQLWVQPGGNAQLIDMPWGDEPDDRAFETGSPGSEPRALALLDRATVLALEGTPRPARSKGPIRAPLPQHAAEILTRLVAAGATCRKFRSALRSTRDRPTEVTRPRRTAHLAVMAALLFVGAGCCMFPLGWLIEMVAGVVPPVVLLRDEQSLNDLDRGAWFDFAASSAGAGPGCWPALGQLHADLVLRERLQEKVGDDRRRADAALDVISSITRGEIALGMKSMHDQRARLDADPSFSNLAEIRRRTHRHFAEQALTESDLPREAEPILMRIALALLLVWPVLWVVWAFLWRGGLSYRILGIDLVRANGRPALRLQCAWRALLVWAPVTGLLVLSLWLQIRFWLDWSHGDTRLWMHTLSSVLWYAALALLAVFVGLAIARPTRALHDRLAGTHLVPR